MDGFRSRRRNRRKAKLESINQFRTIRIGCSGTNWGEGKPRFVDEFVIGYTKHVNEKEGVVTWDVPIDYAQGLD
jgi:hypothetical protein